MSKNYIKIVLVAFVFILTSCGVSNHFLQTRVSSHPQISLQDNNFKVIKTVKGEATSISIFGIGSGQRKNALDNAIVKMYNNANLQGSQTIVDILPSMRVKNNFFFGRVWNVEVVGTVIEFTDGQISHKSENTGAPKVGDVVLPVVSPIQQTQKEPTFDEIINKSTSPSSTALTSSTVFQPTQPTQQKPNQPTTPISEVEVVKDEVAKDEVEMANEETSVVETVVQDGETRISISKMKRELMKTLKKVNVDRVKTRDDYEEAMLNLDIAEEYNSFVKDEKLAHQITRTRQYLEVRESYYQ